MVSILYEYRFYILQILFKFCASIAFMFCKYHFNFVREYLLYFANIALPMARREKYSALVWRTLLSEYLGIWATGEKFKRRKCVKWRFQMRSSTCISWIHCSSVLVCPSLTQKFRFPISTISKYFWTVIYFWKYLQCTMFVQYNGPVVFWL